MTQTKHPLVVIPGDGIGPEVTRAAIQVLEAANAPIAPHEHHAGLAALDECGEVLPQSTLNAIRNDGIALKGPCTTPVGKGFRSVNVQLRQQLELYAAIRPVRSLDGIKTRYEGVDLVVFRENTEGLYAGVENVIIPGVVTTTKVVTEKASMRIARAAFAYAKQRGREKVTVFHKANIMKITDGLFLERVEKVHTEEYPEVPYETMIIDAGCMRLVQDPTKFDVLLMENFYGDVISDLCAGLVGGLGVTPGANIGDNAAIFEAVHGSAPDIAGQNKANPLALIMSSVMLLNYLHETRGDTNAKASAQKIKLAYNAALAAGEVTADLGGSQSTDAFAESLISRIKS